MSTSKSLAPASLFVRKFTDSNVIGAHERLSSSSLASSIRGAKESQDEARVISCDFQMKIPSKALRIDMSILLSTNSNISDCEDDPSVSYKITICTPLHHYEDAISSNDETISLTTTSTTLRWTSKFTVASGNQNRHPFHEWSGSFDLGNKKDIDISECAFHQVEGTFSARYDETDGCAKPIKPSSLAEREMHERTTKKNRTDHETDLWVLPDAKRRRTNHHHPMDQNDHLRIRCDQEHVVTPIV